MIGFWVLFVLLDSKWDSRKESLGLLKLHTHIGFLMESLMEANFEEQEQEQQW